MKRKRDVTDGDVYWIVSVIGKGGQGAVTKVRRGEEKECYALKKVKCPGTYHLESEALEKLSGCKHVVGLIHSIRRRRSLVLELADCSLHDAIYEGDQMTLETVKSYMKQIVTGLTYCHDAGVIHGDVKPRNILLFGDTLKLCDFGLAKIGDEEDRDQGPCTVNYRPPEALMGDHSYVEASDAWATGCTFAALACGADIFDGNCETTILYGIFELLGTPTEDTWKGVTRLPGHRRTFPVWKGLGLGTVVGHKPVGSSGLDLIKRLMSYPLDRMLVRDALHHKFFTK